MKFRPSTYALIATFFTLSALAVISWFIFPVNPEGRSLESWILRPNADIAGFSIVVGTGKSAGLPEITVEKRNGVWFVYAGGKSSVPADPAFVDSFLATIKRERRIWRAPLARKTSALMPNAITASFIGPDQTIASEIAFLGFDASAARIRFRSARDIAILETDDDLSRFLSTESSSWIDHEPFRELESKSAIQRVIVDVGGKRKTITKNRAQSLVDALTSLICQDAAPSMAEADRVVALSLEFGDLSSLRLYISTGKDGSVKVETGDERAWYISSWGAQRLLTALGDATQVKISARHYQQENRDTYQDLP